MISWIDCSVLFTKQKQTKVKTAHWTGMENLRRTVQRDALKLGLFQAGVVKLTLDTAGHKMRQPNRTQDAERFINCV